MYCGEGEEEAVPMKDGVGKKQSLPPAGDGSESMDMVGIMTDVWGSYEIQLKFSTSSLRTK